MISAPRSAYFFAPTHNPIVLGFLISLPQKHKLATHERISGLDMVRAIAILSVVAAHSVGFLAPLMRLPYIGRLVAFSIDHSQPVGALGVELFFVLSGFLIGNILIKTYLAAPVFSFAVVRNFWIRRWFRTLPNYWLILTANIILYAALHMQPLSSVEIPLYGFMQNLWSPPPVFFFNEAWSLSIEEWFYITLPVVLCLSAIILKPVDKPRFLIRAFIGYLLIFVLVRFINAFHPINGHDQDNGIRKVVLFRLDAVMYGVLFAWLCYFRPVFISKAKGWLMAISIIGSGILFFLITKRSLHFTSSSDSSVRFFSDAFLYLLLPLFFSCCLPYAASIRQLKSVRIASVITFISIISYSMYLVHYTLIYLPFFYPLHITSIAAVILLYIVYWAVVIGLSAALYRYFEKPIMNLRDKLSPR